MKELEDKIERAVNEAGYRVYKLPISSDWATIEIEDIDALIEVDFSGKLVYTEDRLNSEVGHIITSVARELDFETLFDTLEELTSSEFRDFLEKSKYEMYLEQVSATETKLDLEAVSRFYFHTENKVLEIKYSRFKDLILLHPKLCFLLFKALDQKGWTLTATDPAADISIWLDLEEEI